MDIRKILPLLKQFGIDPEQIGPEKIMQLIQLTKNVNNPNDMTDELSSQIINTLGISTRGIQEPKRTKSIRVGRNQRCPCNSGFKYKKCCIFKNE